MEFLLKLDVNQVNMVIRGLENVRDSASGLVQNIVGQVQLQNAIVNRQQEATITPDNTNTSTQTDESTPAVAG